MSESYEPSGNEDDLFPDEDESPEALAGTGSPTDMPYPGFVAPLLDEPPVAPDDTRPRAPVTLADDAPAPPPDEAELAPSDVLFRRLAAEEPPRRSLADTAEMRAAPPSAARAIMLGLVMLGAVCMCLTLVSFAGFAGYRDGLATNDRKVTQTLATGIAQQYATGVVDLEQGYAELAAARFSWIVETVQAPTEYALDSPAKLAVARTMAAFTPTPASTLTVTPSPNPAATLMPTAMLTEPPLPTLNPAEDPAYLYDQAATSMRLARYEDAIAWLDALQALAPDYRAAETQAMLMDALTEQGKIYLRGQNKDGEDRLARGVLLIYRADDIGDVEPSTLLGEAIFAELYLNARNYVNGGYYDNAISILEDLCRQNCLWGYPGWDPVTVQDLLDQARAGASQ